LVAGKYPAKRGTSRIGRHVEAPGVNQRLDCHPHDVLRHAKLRPPRGGRRHRPSVPAQGQGDAGKLERAGTVKTPDETRGRRKVEKGSALRVPCVCPKLGREFPLVASDGALPVFFIFTSHSLESLYSVEPVATWLPQLCG